MAEEKTTAPSAKRGGPLRLVLGGCRSIGGETRKPGFVLANLVLPAGVTIRDVDKAIQQGLVHAQAEEA